MRETTMQLTTSQLAQLADEAYGAALSADDAAERAYAAGIEDFARHLLGKGTSPALAALLNVVERKREQRARLARQAAFRVFQGEDEVCSYCDTPARCRPIVSRTLANGERAERAQPTGDRICSDCSRKHRGMVSAAEFKRIQAGAVARFRCEGCGAAAGEECGPGCLSHEEVLSA